jgi:hypothetical protein
MYENGETGRRWNPELGIYADSAGQPPESPKRLPEMTDAERTWFEAGAEQGFLRFYSICSSHKEHDEACGRCGIGSWGVAAFNGLWAFQGGHSVEQSNV